MWLCYWCVVDRRPSQFNNDTPLRGARTTEHSLDNIIKLIIQALCMAATATHSHSQMLSILHCLCILSLRKSLPSFLHNGKENNDHNIGVI